MELPAHQLLPIFQAMCMAGHSITYARFYCSADNGIVLRSLNLGSLSFTSLGSKPIFIPVSHESQICDSKMQLHHLFS